MKTFNIIFSVILCLIYGYLSYLLNDLGLLSNKVLTFAFIFVFLIIIAIIVCLLKLKSKIIKIILYIISTVIMIISILGIYYLRSTINFIDNFGNTKKEYDYYYVIVMKDSKYNTISDLKGKLIGTTDEINTDVLDKIKINYEKKIYETNNGLVNSLYSKKIDAIIISDIGEYLLESEDDSFTKKVRVIKTIKLPKDDVVEKSDKKIVDEPFILYVSGIDTNGAISKVSRSDVNIIITVNPKTRQVLLTSIPRDYYVQLHGTTGVKDKLTHAGIYGINKSITTIEDLLQINIDYYARVNFDTVVNLVDQIGGISIYSDQDLSFCNIKKGYNNVDGKCALRFARERHSYQTGDRHRGENQEEVIKAIISKVQSSSSILTKYSSILNNLKNNFETNASNDVVKEFIKLQMKDMKSWQVESFNLNGYDSHNYTYSMGSAKLYVMEPDMNTVNKVKDVINKIIEGKTFYDLGM